MHGEYNKKCTLVQKHYLLNIMRPTILQSNDKDLFRYLHNKMVQIGGSKGGGSGTGLVPHPPPPKMGWGSGRGDEGRKMYRFNNLFVKEAGGGLV